MWQPSFSHLITRPITAGVPQGSVLEPLLYTLFTTDLTDMSPTIEAMFADDTALLASSLYHPQAIADLQSALDKLQSWMTRCKNSFQQ